MQTAHLTLTRRRLTSVCVMALMSLPAGGCGSKTSKSLPELAEFLNKNGSPGSFQLMDPNQALAKVEGKEIKFSPATGELARGTFTDAVDGTIKSTFCTLILFDSEASAKVFAAGDAKRTANGCFVVSVSGAEGQNKNLVYTFSQFTPFK